MLVRYAIKELQRPYVQEWDAVFYQLQEKIDASGLPLMEATEHGWHDRFEYAIYNGATDEMLPTLQGIAQEMGCRMEYPCGENPGTWYNPEELRGYDN